MDSSHAVYAMAVAAELTGVNPPMLRAYEEKGLISPLRTDGGTRRYSADDIAEIHHISDLLGGGLNLAGVEAVLALETEVRSLRDEVARLQAQARQAQARQAQAGQAQAGQGQAEPRGTL